jgi:ribose transport system substrate-binding protein
MVAALGASGCSAKDAAVDRPISIAWISKGATNSIFEPGRAGAKDAGEHLSLASGKTVDVLLVEPEDGNADQQADKIREAQAAGVAAIGISVLNASKASPLLDQAESTGTLVLTFDSDAPDSKRSAYYGIDNRKAGAQAAHLLAAMLDSRGQVVILANSDQAPNNVARVDGFNEALAAAFPEMEVVDTVYCGAAEEAATNGCTSLLEDALTNHPEVTGFYHARGRALREVELATKAPIWAEASLAGRVKSVGFDAVPEALGNMRAGLVHALIGQKYYAWGYDIVSMAFYSAIGQTRPSGFIDSGFDVVCPNNVVEMDAIWHDKDFTRQLPACELLAAQ